MRGWLDPQKALLVACAGGRTFYQRMLQADAEARRVHMRMLVSRKQNY
jgi:hypothetical protein